MIRRCPAIFAPDHWCGPARRLHLRRRKIAGIRIGLQCRAMRDLLAASAELDRRGIRWGLTSGSLSGFRSCKTQLDIIRRICGGTCASGCPGLAAPCGNSAHNVGLGLDAGPHFPRDLGEFRTIMARHHWHHPDLPNDPNHLSHDPLRK